MKLKWQVEKSELQRLDAFRSAMRMHKFVSRRRARNVERSQKLVLDTPEIWRVHLGCLLTTQQRSGKGSRVSVLLCARPFPLGYDACIAARSCEKLIQGELKQRGIRRAPTIARAAALNLHLLEAGGWDQIRSIAIELTEGGGKDQEQRRLL